MQRPDGVSMAKAYCSRCSRKFPSRQALQQHLDNSARHNRCEECEFDASILERLLAHYKKTQHCVICLDCDGGAGVIWDPDSREYLDHVEDYNVCTTCHQHFRAPANLENHKIVHLAPTIECLGCLRKFTTYPAMILHLEAGTCDSGIDLIDLNESAALCYQWKAYLDEEYRGELLECCDLEIEYGGSVYPFHCPECKVVFKKLSGLFQHVYSNTCDQDLDSGKIGKLVRWLKKQHGCD